MVDEVVACYTMQGVVHNPSYSTPAVKKVTRFFGPDRGHHIFSGGSHVKGWNSFSGGSINGRSRESNAEKSCSSASSTLQRVKTLIMRLVNDLSLGFTRKNMVAPTRGVNTTFFTL